MKTCFHDSHKSPVASKYDKAFKLGFKRWPAVRRPRVCP